MDIEDDEMFGPLFFFIGLAFCIGVITSLITSLLYFYNKTIDKQEYNEKEFVEIDLSKDGKYGIIKTIFWLGITITIFSILITIIFPPKPRNIILDR